MRKIGIFIFMMQMVCQVYAQPEGLKPELAKSNRIQQSIATLDMESDNPELENLEVQFFEFDAKGRCFRKKYVNPIYDVVSTSNEYIQKFDDKDNLVEEIKIHKSELLTEKDKEFIGMFGETNDTTINQYKYDLENKLLREIEFQVGSEDTLVVEYQYQESLLEKSKQFNTEDKGELSSNNISRFYFYDSLGRLEKVKETPETLNDYSISTFQYLGDSENIVEEKLRNDFQWIRTYKDKKMHVELSQDSLNGKITRYEYDKDEKLTKKTIYKSLSDLESNFYGHIYTYDKGLLVEEQSFDQSEDVIMFITKRQYEYDSNGLLLSQKMVYGEELRYTYRFKHEKK